ncbi:MAG: hypothetical protein SGPRY_014250, partial [Prymnesium sp.]
MEEPPDSSNSTACLLLGLSAASQPSPSEHIPPHAERAPDNASGGDRRSQVAALPRKEWNEAEDALIKAGVERLGCRWRVIAAMLPGRSDDAVRNRWSRLHDSHRGAAGKAERPADACLDGSAGAAESEPPRGSHAPTSGCVSGKSGTEGSRKEARGQGRGESGAGRVANKSAKTGNSKSETLDHSNGKGVSSSGEQTAKKERTSWTRSEDDVIMRGVVELGHKWYEIARRLPGRTDHAIRNRWSRLQSIMQAAHA